MNLKSLAFALLSICATHAASAQTLEAFTGKYTLVGQGADNEVYCFDSFSVSINGSKASFGATMTLIEGEVNGDEFGHSRSTDLVSGTSYHLIKYDEDNKALSFITKGTSGVLIPLTRSKYSSTITLSEDGTKATLERRLFDGVAVGIGKTDKALCYYSKK